MKRTFTGWILVIISWTIFFGGIILGGFYWYVKSWAIGGIILAGSIVLAVILRLLANVGEFLFHLNSNSLSILKNISQVNQSLDINAQKTVSFMNSLKEDFFSSNQKLKGIIQHTQNVNQTLQQVNCDSKDINQNLYKLTSFLEEIEKHLDLRK